VSKQPSKASLLKKCRDIGIPIPSKPTTAELEHRLEHWIPGKGWVVRLAKRSTDKKIEALEFGIVYWMPNSNAAHDIIATRKVFVLTRTPNPPKDAVVLDVSKGLLNRKMVGVTNGDNDGSN